MLSKELSCELSSVVSYKLEVLFTLEIADFYESELISISSFACFFDSLGDSYLIIELLADLPFFFSEPQTNCLHLSTSSGKAIG
jgi:hypothetical protein